jgi:hypothetical protein
LQNLVEQPSRHSNLGHLEHDVSTMAHDSGADLHQLVA